MFRSNFIEVEGKILHYLSWGPPSSHAVIIWHGIFGTCRDHENLASRLAADGYFVIAPDAPLCGLSDWAGNKDHDASLSSYSNVAAALIESIGLESVSWIGASKGGALGIVLAGQAQRAPITHLILNDVGPELPQRFRAGLLRLIENPPAFPSLPAFRDYLQNFLGKGGLEKDEEGWLRLARSWSRRKDDGSFTFHFDTALAGQFTHHPEDFDLWGYWTNMSAKTLLIRGAHSVVGEDEAARMRSSGPKCEVIERAGGHISMLDRPAEQDLVLDFLRR